MSWMWSKRRRRTGRFLVPLALLTLLGASVVLLPVAASADPWAQDPQDPASGVYVAAPTEFQAEWVVPEDGDFSPLIRVTWRDNARTEDGFIVQVTNDGEDGRHWELPARRGTGRTLALLVLVDGDIPEAPCLVVFSYRIFSTRDPVLSSDSNEVCLKAAPETPSPDQRIPVPLPVM